MSAKLAGYTPPILARNQQRRLHQRQHTQTGYGGHRAVGYVPNKVARSLRSKQTSMLALVLADVTNPFFTTVARGVEDAANALNSI